MNYEINIKFPNPTNRHTTVNLNKKNLESGSLKPGMKKRENLFLKSRSICKREKDKRCQRKSYAETTFWILEM